MKKKKPIQILKNQRKPLNSDSHIYAIFGNSLYRDIPELLKTILFLYSQGTYQGYQNVLLNNINNLQSFLVKNTVYNKNRGNNMSLPFVTRAYFVFKIILGWSEIPLYRELMAKENSRNVIRVEYDRQKQKLDWSFGLDERVQ